ncbi:MAG: methyltransferase type 11 [Nitrosomonadaceae bacterium]|nr:methyltransferase type 11 [Nitrosomonadaceae bacterium]
MSEINLLNTHPTAKRNYDKRAAEKTPEIIRLAKQFGKDFFDGDRKCGYGGYKYDGRWKAVVERMRQYYNLPSNAAILDVGCGKGFMLHDFKEVMPNCSVAGIDVSEYALEHSMPSVKPFLKVASAEPLPYPDNSFDLVVSINSIHNLPLEACKKSLQEIERVSKGKSYITVDAWRNDLERENLLKWVLTAETYMHVNDWKKLFSNIGFTGDYYWFIAD